MITVIVPVDGADWPSTDFIFATNATLDLRFTLTQDGQPVDLAGQSLRAQFRPAADDSNVALDLSTEKSSLVILDAAAGIYQMTAPAETIAGLSAGAYEYDLIGAINNDPRRIRYQTGTATVQQGVTR